MKQPVYRVYLITHTLPDESIKRYVGLTIQPLHKRLQAHRGNAARKEKRVVKGSLGEAMRVAYARAPDSKAFGIEELSRHDSIMAMRQAEVAAISEWGTAAPGGYNLMPGGASVGGPSNSKPVTVSIHGSSTSFPSLSELCRALCPESDSDDIFYSRVNQRLRNGWSLEEAVGLMERADRRVTDRSKRAASSGEKLATLRSREYRQTKRVEPFDMKLPHPTNPKDTVSAADFARLKELPKSTVVTRAKRIGEAALKVWDRDRILDALCKRQERSRSVTVRLPGDAGTIEESIRALARRFASGNKGGGRLGEQAIRQRLAKLFSDANPSNDEILKALGLGDKPLPVGLSDVGPHFRKTHCSDWSIHEGGLSRDFARQVDFCRAASLVLESVPKDVLTPLRKRFLAVDMAGRVARLQRWVSNQTRHGKTPTEIAGILGVLSLLLHAGSLP